MNCQEFGRLTNDFINQTIDYRKLNDFLSHDKSCPDCHDDLEINFLMSQILQNEDNTSYNLADALKNHTKMVLKKRRIYYIRRITQTLIYIIADIIAAIAAVNFLFSY